MVREGQREGTEGGFLFFLSPLLGLCLCCFVCGNEKDELRGDEGEEMRNVTMVTEMGGGEGGRKAVEEVETGRDLIGVR